MVTYNVGDRVIALVRVPANRSRSLVVAADITTEQLGLAECLVVRVEPLGSHGSALGYMELLTTSFSYDNPTATNLGGHVLPASPNGFSYIESQFNGNVSGRVLPAPTLAAAPFLRQFAYPKPAATSGYISLLKDILRASRTDTGAALGELGIADIEKVKAEAVALGVPFFPLDMRSITATYQSLGVDDAAVAENTMDEDDSDFAFHNEDPDDDN